MVFHVRKNRAIMHEKRENVRTDTLKTWVYFLPRDDASTSEILPNSHLYIHHGQTLN